MPEVSMYVNFGAPAAGAAPTAHLAGGVPWDLRGWPRARRRRPACGARAPTWRDPKVLEGPQGFGGTPRFWRNPKVFGGT